ncbi:hypothetical protein [Hymenobacter roseosalivarius]|nr:hypothetical protein [Hymenobacter roseosalivarius]
MAGLAEGRCTGRPPKLTEAAQKKVADERRPATQQLRTLLPRVR